MRMCVPIKVKTAKEALKIAALVRKKGIALVEIWLDPLPVRERETVLRKLKKPFIVKSLNPETLISACEFKSSFLDVDVNTQIGILKKIIKHAHSKKVKIILSFHDFKKTPPLHSLIKIIRKSFALDADISKIATFINHFEENVVLFELTKRISRQGKKIIALGMGEHGKISRIGTPLLGGYLTYIAYDEKHRTAPGQMVLKDLPLIRYR